MTPPAKRKAPAGAKKGTAKKVAAPVRAVFERVGTTIQKIPVRISYRIIQLFSAGLYSSPNKAVEELVSNSWDAGANRCWLFLPPNLDADDATVWVVDDGESMDVDGLFDLWQIASSTKRARPDIAGREPIGKFGIGKLATYVLADRVTYICKRGGKYLAVTMDFADVDPEKTDEDPIDLDVRSLTLAQAREALTPLASLEDGETLMGELFGRGAAKTWTAVALNKLKPAADRLKVGRVKWIISNGLPMNETFEVRVDGSVVPSALEDIDDLGYWWCGEEELVDLPDGVEAGTDDTGPYIKIEGLPGEVRGEITVYEDTLVGGRAAEFGRSHGFFVKVRGRLINLDEPLFGIHALSHSTFNRFRMVVDADGLDEFLASTRESVMEQRPVELLKKYLNAAFNEARLFYEDFVAGEADAARISTRIGRIAPSVSRRPLVAAVRALVAGEVDHMLLIERPDLDDEAGAALVDELEELVESGGNPVEEVELAALGVDRFIASYNPVTRILQVNTLHPFFGNFLEHLPLAHSAFEMLAAAEVFTEAYLFESGLKPAAVQQVLRRRDQFLRELVSANRQGPAVIAQNLLDQVDDADGLEQASFEAFQSLGFEVTKIGGKGTPDGVAKAFIGARSHDSGAGGDYSFTYDAKSTGRKKVTTKDVHASGLKRHRNDYGAQHTVVVGRDFDGDGTREAVLGVECVDNDLTPIRAKDLATLVRIAPLRQIGYSRLVEWLETCRSPNESAAWVKAQLDVDEEQPPLRELLEAIAAEHKASGGDAVDISTVASTMRKAGITISRNRAIELVKSLQALCSGYIYFDGEHIVALEQSVERIIAEVHQQTQKYPKSLLKKALLGDLLDGD